MEILIAWWHWIIFGIVLILLELLTGTFIMLGLGISALMVGIMSFLMLLSFNTELFFWILFCIVFIIIWFKFVKQKDITHVGQSNYRLDTIGEVTKDITPGSRGEVIFEFPVLGNTKWKAISKEEIKKGEKVKIVKIDGELIEVTK